MMARSDSHLLKARELANLWFALERGDGSLEERRRMGEALRADRLEVAVRLARTREHAAESERRAEAAEAALRQERAAHRAVVEAARSDPLIGRTVKCGTSGEIGKVVAVDKEMGVYFVRVDWYEYNPLSRDEFGIWEDAQEAPMPDTRDPRLLTPEAMAAIAKRLAAATPGPWSRCMGASGKGCSCGQVSQHEFDFVICTPALERDFDDISTPEQWVVPNAAFIAAAPTDIERLRDHVAAQAAEIERLRAVVEAAREVESESGPVYVHGLSYVDSAKLALLQEALAALAALDAGGEAAGNE